MKRSWKWEDRSWESEVGRRGSLDSLVTLVNSPYTKGREVSSIIVISGSIPIRPGKPKKPKPRLT